MKKVQEILKVSNALKALYNEESEQNGSANSVFNSAARYLDEYAESLLKKEAELKLSRANTKWTDDEDEKLKKEFEAGHKIAKMAKAHSRGISGIVSRLAKLGLIADEGENGKKHWSEKEDAQLYKEAVALKSLEWMAESHGRSLSGILSRLEKLGYDIDSRG